MQTQALSPMMQQYLEIKKEHRDSILLFRLGDFYEMFFEDAKIASEELDLVLTGRDCGQKERAPMCGVPYHSCEAYISRLVSKGYRVAICEQMEDPSQVKGIVKRSVVRVVTPGTVTEDSMLDEAKNNYLCALCFSEGACSVCFVDASTGALHLTTLSGEELSMRVCSELSRFSPSEVLIADDLCKSQPALVEFIRNTLGARLTALHEDAFSAQKAKETILSHFRQQSLKALCLEDGAGDTAALGAALYYLYQTRMTGLECISTINRYAQAQYMRLDLTAMRNLELCQTIRTKEKRGTLLWVLDRTKTPMGKRRIQSWIDQPLMDITLIERRLNAVEELYGNAQMRGELIEYLTGIHDLERLMARVIYAAAGGRELKSISASAACLPQIKAHLAASKSKLLREIDRDMDALEDISARIEETIADEPPVSVREGGFIKKGFDAQIDALREDLSDGKGLLAKIEAAEKERTGIRTLKVRYNKVFGYYIEVSNSFVDQVPPDYIRKQTLVNGERFITDELKRLEARILGAREQVQALEYEAFETLRKWVAEQLERVQRTANAVARLDVLCSFADVAAGYGYNRPSLNNKGYIHIIEGRHPVVERVLHTPFVPNDTLLDCDANRTAIITGPNMAGKSTYMRQVALITLMAQIGSFVPAQSADIGIVDAIFTRIGASDDLSAGQSTFMVEMSEIANILRNATRSSLLVLDEIGRGTSTFDGMSIARAVLEYTADRKKLGAKTLFATHYHELTTLEQQIDGIRNYNIAVKKRGDDITFLRRIVPGGADESYGIEVAKLSGIPATVIDRAKQILRQIEQTAPGQSMPKKDAPARDRLPMEDLAVHDMIDRLRNIDTDTLTPIEALQVLSTISNQAKKL